MIDLQKNLKKLLVSSWPFILILVATALFFWKVLLLKQVPIPGDFVVGVYYPWLDYKWGFATGVPVKNPITTDVVSFTYPMQMLAIDMLKSGQLPLWNPYILAGTPLLANFQSAPFSPTNIVYFIFDKLTGWSIQIILQHVLAAVFTYFLLRHWRVSKLGSVFGGVIFAFSGFNVIWSQWNGHALAAAFIPLIILFVDKWLIQGKWISGILISISLALLFLSGYPQVAIYLLIALGLLWIFRIIGNRHWLLRTIFLAIFLVIGLGLAAPQILPGAELLKYSQRQIEPLPSEWAFLPWSKVITFIAPDYFGNHATKNYWGPQDYTSNTGFVGVIPFSLALFGLALFKKSKEVKYILALMLASLIFAFPTPVSIFLWKSGIFGLNAASAHRALVLFNLSIALLAGFGIDHLSVSKKIPFKYLILPALIILGFGAYALAYFLLNKYYPGIFSGLVKNIPAYSVALRNMVLPVGAFVAVLTGTFLIRKLENRKRIYIVLVLFVLMTLELCRFGWKFTPFSPRSIVFPATPVLSFLESEEKPIRVTGSYVIPINMRMPYKIESFEGYDAIYPLRIAKIIAAINSGKSGTYPVGRYGTIDNTTSPLLDLLNTKYYLAIKKDFKGNPELNGKIPSIFSPERFNLAFEDKTVAILESKSTLPRAFMVFDWERATSDTKTLDTLLQNGFPYGKKIIVEDYDKMPDAGEGKFEVEYTKYSETESQINIKTTKAGLLFISDTDFPGWYAFVDGKETPIYRADFAFRAIEVAEGTHGVKMVYRPASFANGLKISAISIIFLFVMIFIANTLRIRKI